MVFSSKQYNVILLFQKPEIFGLSDIGNKQKGKRDAFQTDLKHKLYEKSL